MVRKNIVVVLGMHRSGTSTITRSLQVLGVNLGDRLMPPVPGNNEKGFWEDLDVNALNIELLAALGHDWHTLTPILPDDLHHSILEPFKLRAVEILRKKLSGVDFFGLKDPRIARLLPFWASVFSHLNVQVSYVVACRNPMSVARSLAKRDGFALEKAYQLWLDHMLASLAGTQGQLRVVVDYDLLMESPASQLQRIAQALNLNFDPDSPAFAEYSENFLEEGLRHSHFIPTDLILEKAAPPQVGELYGALLQVAKDQVASSSQDVDQLVVKLFDGLRQDYPLLNYTDRCEHRITELSSKVAAQQEQISGCSSQIDTLSQAISERDVELGRLYDLASGQECQIHTLGQNISERDAELGKLHALVSEQECQIRTLSQSLSGQDEKLSGLSQVESECSNRIRIFERELSERDEQIIGLVQAVSEREAQLESLRLTLSANDHDVAVLRQQVAAILSSRSWKLTRPLRAIGAVGRQLKAGHKEAAEVVPADDSIACVSAVCTPAQYPADCSEDFDRDFYLQLYSDVRDAGIDPEEHFRLHGMQEGRLGRAPELDLRGDFGSFKAERETILIVSHEASLTGAPIVSLNLVQMLAEKYNIVALLLGGGVIESEFDSTGVVVACAPAARGAPVVAELVIESLRKFCSFKFAIVNSIESCSVLRALARQYIPTVSLIHEFAAYTRPKHKFLDALSWSSASVFSSQITLDSARTECVEFNGKTAHIIPQGCCTIPRQTVDIKRLESDRLRILRAFHPKGKSDDSVVVLGVGAVQLRKGVDLFIECASRVRRLAGGEHCRFVWIGSGFNAEHDVSYSVYLADQIRRAGLEGNVFFMDETQAIETAYEEADMLLLSSRLDPLPNVAIDGMAHGLPVLCFDKTTGIAEILIEQGLGQACVAGYLDTSDMAEKILVMANSVALRSDIGARSRALVHERFDMKNYVESLEHLALESESHIRQEKADAEEILASGHLRLDFVVPPHWRGMTDEEVARRYIRGWATGIACRKPMPGFHPGVYEAEHGLSGQGADPFADYLRAGCPPGAWTQKVIAPQQSCSLGLPEGLRVGLHLHVFYPELLEEMLKRLRINRVVPDLFISVSNERAGQSVAIQLEGYSGKSVVKVVPNRGRDIGPMLTAFGAEILDGYDVLGHLHTKVSADVKDTSVGENWYRFLLENLLGGQAGAMADTILAEMANDASMGVVLPDDPYVVGWGKNKHYGEALAKQLGISDLPDHFNFPVGTMFWARVSVLRPLIELGLDWDDYPEEPLPYDGSLLHAIERIIPFLAFKDGGVCAVTNVPGVTR